MGVFLAPSSAFAAAPHPFLETFGSAAQPSFGEPEGMAVDQSTGDLLVIGSEAKTFSRFNPAGTPADFSALAANVIDGSETPQGSFSFGSASEVQVAVDNSGGVTDGDIYVPQLGAGLVDIFASSGKYIGQLTASSEGNLTEPCGVAVDPSGNVYVGDFSGKIHKYTPAANPAVNADSSANLNFESNCTLAAGAGPTAGFIFAAHFNGAVAKLDSASGAEAYEVFAGPTRTLSVDPSTGHLYLLGDESTTIREFDASGASSASEVSSITLASEGRGVAVSATSANLYATREGDANVEVFAPGPPGTAELELTVHDAGFGSGTVASSPTGIECGSECAAKFLEGSEVELTATPAEGSQFTGWSATAGDPGTCTATTSPCKVTMAEAVELEATFDRLPPAVSAATPNEGPLGGGQTVTITGTDLDEATEVDFGATAVTSFESDSPTEIVLQTPAHAAGEVDVTVTTAHGGTSTTGPSDTYTFVNAPAVSAISPGEGPSGGGTPVEIAGTNLDKATQVQFGSTVVEAPFTEDTAGKIKLNAPGHAAGTFDVIVTTIGGTSPATPADDYTFVGDPAVFAVSPANGPINGGNVVEITGTHLAEASQVQFGTTIVSAPFIADSASAIRLTAPAHAAGTVDVRVTTLAGISARFSADHYTYETPLVTTVTETPVLLGTPPPAGKPPPSPPPPPPASNHVRVGSAKRHGASISLTLTVPAPGTLTATGRGLRRATVAVAAAGTVSLKLELTTAAAKQLKRRGRLALTVTIAFTPTGGTRATATKTITFKAKRKGK
jgi:hypothetical protein